MRVESLFGIRSGVALSLTAFGTSLACATLLVVAHLTPDGLTTHEVYNFAFIVHGAPILVLLPALLLLLSELGQAPPQWRPRWLLPAAWLAIALEALAIGVILVTLDSDGTQWQRWVGLSFLPPNLLVAANVLTRLQRTTRARDLALAFAAIVQLVGLGLILPLDLAKSIDPIEHAGLLSFGHVFTGALLEATALAALAAALGESHGRRGPLVPVVVLALIILVPRPSFLQFPSSLAATVCAAWLVVLSLKRRDAPPRSSEGVLASLAAVTFLEATVVGLLHSISTAIYLRDTYLVVGSFHLQVTACVVAVLALGFRHNPSDGRQLVASLAAVLCVVGSQLMGLAMVVVGARGMPRRYYSYLPEFQTWHRAIAIGGCLLMLGIGLALFDIGRRAKVTARSPRPAP